MGARGTAKAAIAARLAERSGEGRIGRRMSQCSWMRRKEGWRALDGVYRET